VAWLKLKAMTMQKVLIAGRLGYPVIKAKSPPELVGIIFINRSIKMNAVTVPADKLAELQLKAAQRDELVRALIFAKEMMIVNDLSLPRTFEVIDEAIAKAKGE
jgi:hypothetical protein